ncbi:SDR family NAD(P)-dependent oxidoreductase [Verminephrobacter eiseniae]|uniref:Short-chain dehydrogenase/reductase SDR n=1 Tax=Verminephrobacter eiseniae (strain EF01-2) TaxID=391735 RepID=A1WM12_VEREI|nr:SDR family NAD(P)-dependent oxidoreductase [Verminephrobacter eiseniae]ABM58669.1 short-chain dehydrogenase/reductase SDR [Verminephrobacter eiseniae EF01-2]MCW5284240.1 SDR family NAD(P)-dependent oxidoreductase [Verminephrobacter eiseniae]MCW5301947.1 SDR family NAD(P)-dependent oxidoreductase [Verminephrobacter eiseniae]MCW8182519.1 SDR family NAD(P)-dependent oxidoreductase [Verminephrobacter eiseniae]MCW8190067.1 SDR family NAD(P)-dependent oxidoreductase [Verminephrobacter eiseniae]
MEQLCKGRVVVITGAGCGLGRAYALEFARQGAKVVVNDLGTQSDGTGIMSAARPPEGAHTAAEGGGTPSFAARPPEGAHTVAEGEGAPVNAPAQQVVAEIRALGGEAVANTDDVSDWEGARRLIQTAITTFGALDVLVNNAGILRDKALVNMDIADFDAVIRVHLRGTFAPMRHAAMYWRGQAKAGRQRMARVINTSSSSGLYGIVGQTNYGPAKAGIANMSIVAARELERYGVTVNAIYPTAMSRLTEDLFKSGRLDPKARGGPGFDPLDAANVAPLVVWLGSVSSQGVTGRVFGAKGGRITVAEGWHAGPHIEKQGRWSVSELAQRLPDLVRRAAPNAELSGEIPMAEA